MTIKKTRKCDIIVRDYEWDSKIIDYIAKPLTKTTPVPVFISSLTAENQPKVELCQVAICIFLIWKTFNVFLFNQHVDGFLDVGYLGVESSRYLL